MYTYLFSLYGVLAQTVTLAVDFNAIATTLISTLLITIIVTLFRGNRTLNQIVDKIGTNHPPEGILGRISTNEREIKDLRDWALQNGFDRRDTPVGKNV